jgi:hypothetical protein
MKVLAFSETAQTELMRLCDGGSVSMQGSLSAEIYQPAGRDAFSDVFRRCDFAVAPSQAGEGHDVEIIRCYPKCESCYYEAACVPKMR